MTQIYEIKTYVKNGLAYMDEHHTDGNIYTIEFYSYIEMYNWLNKKYNGAVKITNK